MVRLNGLRAAASAADARLTTQAVLNLIQGDGRRQAHRTDQEY
jgi:hypothetical protein